MKTVAAWGYNGDGQTTVPAGLSNVVGIAAGAFHSLALKADGTVVAWGNNGYGHATVPAGLSNVVAIAAGYDHSLALVANAYDSWRATYWPGDPNGPSAARLADPDGDGILNAMEYALGMVPTVASPAELPKVARSGSTLQFTFFRAKPEVTYEVQESTDLQTWTTVATNPGTVGTSVTVSVAVPTGPGAKKFLKLKVTLP